jgi:hypothetical protein
MATKFCQHPLPQQPMVHQLDHRVHILNNNGNVHSHAMEVSKFFSNGKMLQQAIDQLRLAPAKVQTSAYCFFCQKFRTAEPLGFPSTNRSLHG